MNSIETYIYVSSYAELLGLEEKTVSDYVEKNGISSLYDHPPPLLTTPEQIKKHACLQSVLLATNQLERKYIKVDTSEKASALIKSIIPDPKKEHFVVLHLNTQHEVINYEIVSVGSLVNSIVHPREVFKSAIVHGAYAILVGHNHPSGSVSPSPDDQKVTRRLKEVGELVGIPVIDHIIVESLNKYHYSFLKEGNILGENHSTYSIETAEEIIDNEIEL